MRSLLVRPVAALLLAASLGACASNQIDPNAPQEADNLAIGVPPVLGGLDVAFSEKTTKKLQNEAKKRSTYVRDLTVFELRAGKELKGVYQVIRMTPDARVEDVDFRRTLAARIGGTQRAPELIGEDAVYKFEGSGQLIHVWFEDRFMQILLLRQSTGFSGVVVDINRLLAEVLALEPRPVSDEGNIDI